MTISVIIPTFNRPDCIRTCLRHLHEQDPRPEQIIVVDASYDERTRSVVGEFPGVIYLKNEAGRGNTPNSRNLAMLHCLGDIVAFLDDDAYVHEGWARNLGQTYGDPTVGGVAGRALNNLPGEAERGVDEIGKLRPNGRLTGNFAADSKGIVDVDHMIGCNMSLRRDVLAGLGGFRDDYPAGPFGICEETEACVRARRLGVRLVYNPAICATHVGAPQPNSRRFGPKYSYYHARNQMVMLIRNYGAGRISWRFLITSAYDTVSGALRKIAGAFAHLIAAFAGLAVGIMAGARLAIRRGTAPERRDAKGTEISAALSRPANLGNPR